MNHKENLIISLVLILSRTVFIFGDAVFSSKDKSIKENDELFKFAKIEQYTQDIPKNNTTEHISEKQILKEEKSLHGSAKEIGYQTKEIEPQNVEKNFQKIEKENQDSGLEKKDFNLKDVVNGLESTSSLEKLYKNNKNKDVLKVLLYKLLEDYNFDKAQDYLSDVNIFDDLSIDAKSYVYTQLNTLSITDPNSIVKFVSFIDQMKYKSLISLDDHLLYQGIAKLWQKDYEGANKLLKEIKSPIYNNFITQINDSINQFNKQKGAPLYYKDSLIALVAMKNGYFSLAQKLAVDSILKDRNYILPYQVIAYSNFLTNNREKAIDNFYELISLDIENKDKYNFYIGVSYYWFGDYQQSILMLSQLTNSAKYKLDTYRYLLLNYKELGNEERMMQIRQRFLGQDDIKESDFKTYYDIVFYQPFAENSKHIIYTKFKQISYDYVSQCYEKFGQKNDTCLYGEVGLDISNANREYVENSLLYLAENYPQAHIFQALGDYYRNNNLDEKSKTYYLKAISLTENISQKNLIEQHLADAIY